MNKLNKKNVRIFFLISIIFFSFFIFKYNYIENKYRGDSRWLSPVSITEIDEENYFVCNYQEVIHMKKSDSFIDKFNLENISPYNYGGVWNPTGVFYLKSMKQLYVANYNGHNVVVFNVDDNLKLNFVREIKNEEMISPENVVVSDDGKNIIVADYDAGKVILFDNFGNLLWSKDVGLGHGVAISKDFIYATSLSNGEILKFDYEGNLIVKTGKRGNGKNEYLWPTSISFDDEKKEVIVTDAHTGKISILDDDLKFIKSFGGNSPGGTKLNFPYSTIVKNNVYLTADTFNNRFVFYRKDNMDIKFVIDPLKTQNYFRKIDFKDYNSNDKYDYTYKSIKFNNDENSNILGKKFLIEKSEKILVSGYNSIDIIGDKGIENELEVDRSGKLYLSYFYMTWLKNIDINNEKLLFIGSPQNSIILVYDFNRNIVFGKNLVNEGIEKLWFNNGEIVTSTGEYISDRELISLFKEELKNYDELILSRKNKEDAYIEAFKETFFDLYGITIENKKEYLEFINRFFTTNEGKKIYESYISSKKFNMTYDDYISKVTSEYYVDLSEILWVRSILEGK